MSEELGTLAVAVFDFEGLRADNLKFSKGDIITIIEMCENGWWKGSDGKGNVGIFPYNYVEVKEDVGGSFPVVKAVFDFEGEGEGELPFKKGDLITLMKELSVDWWVGKTKEGHEGHFPANRVEKTELEDVQTAKEEKKRWSKIKKEKKKEAEKAEKARLSLARKVAKEEAKKKQEAAEAENLREQARQAAERARQAEEELAKIKAEAELLRKQQRQMNSRVSVKIRKEVESDIKKVQDKANATALKFGGNAPGPPPAIEEDFPTPPEEEEDLFKPVVNNSSSEPEKVEKKFKYRSKFANLGGGTKCKRCNKTVGFADKVKALGGEYHTECFTCSTCSVRLTQGEWRENDNNPYCHKCHAQGFGIKGYGFGGSVVPVSAGEGPAKGEVDEAPLFKTLETK